MTHEIRASSISAEYMDQFLLPDLRWLPCHTRSIPFMFMSRFNDFGTASNSVLFTH
ncbi:hypothetical protein ABIB14_002857 [Arthrobacter sp. UYEF3]